MSEIHCGFLKKGDQGQRYEVRCQSTTGEIRLGWTDREDGEPFVSMVNRHPILKDPKIIDRQKK